MMDVVVGVVDVFDLGGDLKSVRFALDCHYPWDNVIRIQFWNCGVMCREGGREGGWHSGGLGTGLLVGHFAGEKGKIKIGYKEEKSE